MADGTNQDAIRHIYNEHAGDDFWKAVTDWARRPEKWGDRFRRFRALQRFCQGQRDNSQGDERHMWNERRKDARRAKRRIWDKAHEPEPTPPSDVCWSLGAPCWGGMRDFFYAEIYPIADRYGMPWEGDDKEPGHAAGGDHDPNVTNAFAEDFPTFSGANFANAVGQHFGRTFNTGTYAFIYTTWQGRSVRIQILWAVADHYNHVHIGARTV